ncbi:MAG: S9 family peptidase [candidate division Zixibacteria bacterium]|nr:S9 family peptidase [candidate division Zixibacteria bacterium]
MKRVLFLLISLCCLASLAAQTDSAYIPDIETFMQIGYCASPGISEDGEQVFFMSSSSGVPQLYRLNESGWPYQLTLFEEGIDWYVLSHDGNSVIIGASVGGNERSQLYLVDAITGRLRQLTDQPEARFGSVTFSPDDKTIYYRSNEINNTDFHIWSIELASGKPTLVQEKTGYNGPIDLTADGNYLLTYTYRSNVDNDLYLFDLTTSEERLLTPHDKPHIYDWPNLTPDGQTMYFITDDNDDGIPRLARMTVATGKWEFLDTDSPWEYEGLLLSGDGRYLVWILNEEGYAKPFIKDIVTGEMLSPPPLDGMYSDAAISKAGKVVFEFRSARHAPDIWMWNIGQEKLTQLTFSTYAGIDPQLFSEPKLIHYKTYDDRRIPAFLYLPSDYTGQPIPFIIDAHGGPESQFRPGFIRHFQYLMLHGFGLLAVNPRGSSGYGQEYQQLDNYKKRLDSVKDYAWAANWLIDNGYTTKEMLGVKGGSYGGYVAMALVTEFPDLFAAGANSVGIVNFVSFLEKTADYRRALREAEYGPLSDREFLKSISPIHKADQIEAALLIIHGENDPRVPVGEARQIIEVMSQRGVPVDSLIFPDEGHGVAKRKNSIIQYRRLVDFFMEHLRP